MADGHKRLQFLKINRAQLIRSNIRRQRRGELPVGVEQPCRNDTVELVQVRDLQRDGELIRKPFEFTAELAIAFLGDLYHLRDTVQDVRVATDDLSARFLAQLPGADGDDASED